MAVTFSSKHAAARHFPIFKIGGTGPARGPVALTKVVCLVGRHIGVHLQLPSSQVSKIHAMIVKERDRVYIRDLASRNHLTVNDQPVREVTLKTGDVLRVGPYLLLCESGFTESPIGDADAPRAPAAGLQLGGDGGADFPLDARAVLIGSRPECDVVLPDEEQVSAIHAVVFELDGKRYVRDLGSATGTFVNDERVHQQPLAIGDEVRIGDARFRYADSATATPTAAATSSTDDADVPTDIESSGLMAFHDDDLGPTEGAIGSMMRSGTASAADDLSLEASADASHGLLDPLGHDLDPLDHESDLLEHAGSPLDHHADLLDDAGTPADHEMDLPEHTDTAGGREDDLLEPAGAPPANEAELPEPAAAPVDQQEADLPEHAGAPSNHEADLLDHADTPADQEAEPPGHELEPLESEDAALPHATEPTAVAEHGSSNGADNGHTAGNGDNGENGEGDDEDSIILSVDPDEEPEEDEEAVDEDASMALEPVGMTDPSQGSVDIPIAELVDPEDAGKIPVASDDDDDEDDEEEAEQVEEETADAEQGEALPIAEQHDDELLAAHLEDDAHEEAEDDSVTPEMLEEPEHAPSLLLPPVGLIPLVKGETTLGVLDAAVQAAAMGSPHDAITTDPRHPDDFIHIPLVPVGGLDSAVGGLPLPPAAAREGYGEFESSSSNGGGEPHDAPRKPQSPEETITPESGEDELAGESPDVRRAAEHAHEPTHPLFDLVRQVGAALPAATAAAAYEADEASEAKPTTPPPAALHRPAAAAAHQPASFDAERESSPDLADLLKYDGADASDVHDDGPAKNLRRAAVRKLDQLVTELSDRVAELKATWTQVKASRPHGRPDEHPPTQRDQPPGATDRTTRPD